MDHMKTNSKMDHMESKTLSFTEATRQLKGLKLQIKSSENILQIVV